MTNAEINKKVAEIKLRRLLRKVEQIKQRRQQRRADSECQAADPANCTDPNCPNGVEAAYNNAIDENVMAFIDEVRSNGGWTIDCGGFVEEEYTIGATYRNINKGNTEQTVTQPYHIVKIPVSDKEIITSFYQY